MIPHGIPPFQPKGFTWESGRTGGGEARIAIGTVNDTCDKSRELKRQ